MEKEILIKGFAQLGKLMVALGNDSEWNGFESGVTEQEYNDLKALIGKQFFLNGWFNKENVQQSLKALGNQLTEKGLAEWTERYSYSSDPKKVAIIMAGNIPLVGFNDFLCVLISGNHAVCKLSSDDKTLLPALASVLIQFVPELKERITFTTGRIGDIEAVIATGSDNSVAYFQQYFGKYKHIFRKNRTSVAVISGNETPEELHNLGHDIFDYFGLGCRNVSHLILSKNYELSRFFEGIFNHSNVITHNKYGNNYDYNKAIFLMNQHQLFDNNFVLLRETEELFSPLAMVYYHFYDSKDQIETYLKSNKESIQAVVGHDYIPFGQAQCPALSDYADGIDTMAFLNTI